MARSTRVTIGGSFPVILRLATPEFDELKKLVFQRYPTYEWATFARVGWRETSKALVLTLAQLDPPRPSELDEKVGHVAIGEPYTLRTALAAEQHPLAVCIIHSHPIDCAPYPSAIDDDMDSYYAEYFGGFAPNRPYVSLIMAMVDGELAISGRIFWRDQWLVISHVMAERAPISAWVGGNRPRQQYRRVQRTARLAAAFGDEAAARLRKSCVAVIGAGGTGSAVIEVLARAGIGRMIVVDPDHVDETNLERLHGGTPGDAARQLSKTLVARNHVQAIDPTITFDGYVGSLPQSEIVDAVIGADVVIGCTDQQHSRLAISDLSLRYLVPGIDCGVTLEGDEGNVTGQIIQLVRFLPSDPCALCRRMTTAQRLSQELMSDDEKQLRRRAAEVAAARGEPGAPYWRDRPQLNTVGYLTTIAGAMAAGYAIGWLTGRFEPPFSRLQMNLVAPFLDVTDVGEVARPDCSCRKLRGWADQGNVGALITAPIHWPPVANLQ